MQIGVSRLSVLVGERFKPHFVQRVGGVGYKLAQEGVLVRIDRMDHQLQELTRFGLELERFDLRTHCVPSWILRRTGVISYDGPRDLTAGRDIDTPCCRQVAE